MLLHRITNALTLIIIILCIDIQLMRAVGRLIKHFSRGARIAIKTTLWSITVCAVVSVCWYHLADVFFIKVGLRQGIVSALLMVYLSKIVTVIIVSLDDIQFGIRKIIYFFKRKKEKLSDGGAPMTRSQFLTKTAIAAGAVPFAASVFGIVHGAYDYRIKRRTIYLPNLPRTFDGIRIGQISDIHLNPNYHKVSVQGGIDMLLQEKTDVIFFTGDLVNFRTNEVQGFTSMFDKIKAPLGVYSVLGNHDYGNYIWWPSEESKRRNLDDMLAVHRQMGYDLLMNEHRFLELNKEKIAIIGIENWGTGRFPKYGKLDVAHQGTDEAAVRLLLSHDPSHWDAQVRPLYPDIDVMFAGHTHGFQMGIEVGDFRWSPAQYTYKQWADLYREGNQHLYVNRGFGCIGYLGRIGMPPELTVIELKRG